MTYKLLDLGYRPAQSHPQIFLLTLIVDPPEVSQLVVQSCQLAIVVKTIVAWRWAMARTMRRRGGRELKHEEMDEECWAFAVQLVVLVHSSIALALDLHTADHVFGQLKNSSPPVHVLSKL